MLIYTKRRILKILDEWIDGHEKRIKELEKEDSTSFQGPFDNSVMIERLTGAVMSFQGLKDELMYGRNYFDKLEDL